MIHMWMPRPGPGAARRYAWAPPPWTADTQPRPEMTRSMPYDWPYNDKNMFTAATNPVTCARRALPRPPLTLPRPASPPPPHVHPRGSICSRICAAGSMQPVSVSRLRPPPCAQLRVSAGCRLACALQAQRRLRPSMQRMCGTRQRGRAKSAACSPQYAGRSMHESARAHV